MMDAQDVEIARLHERVMALQNIIDRDIVEVRRRLDELNHEHARNTERNKEYLASPLFYQYRDENAVWREQVNRALANLEGRTATWVTVLGIVFLVVQVVMRFWK